jgi:two-component system osmolarity sensor histidine kinase EnvZ
MRLRDYTPRGYQARHILILILPMIVFVIAMTLFFFNSHVQQVNTKLGRAVAQEVALVIRERQAGQDFDAMARNLNAAGLMTVDFLPGAATLTPPAGKKCCDELRDELEVHVKYPFAFAEQPGDFVKLSVLLPDGQLDARFDRKRAVAITAHIFIVWSIGFSILLLATSYAFLRNQVRSMIELAHAADAFGRGEDVVNFKPSGASEVRQAARSVIRMRNRIRRYADQRTAMLAGVSHDLRTPLTRLKLELALLPKGTDSTAAKADIAEMEQMLDGYLAFARGEEGEQPVETDIPALTKEAVAHLGERTKLEIIAQQAVSMRLRPLAMKRAISNLANNAADYGGKVRVTVAAEAGSAVVTVEDDGPGIPDTQYEDAFRPFSRLDAARNQNVSGVGLGLTIARDTARAHGGDVVLGRSELGGLKATLRLPFGATPVRDRERD